MLAMVALAVRQMTLRLGLGRQVLIEPVWSAMFLVKGPDPHVTGLLAIHARLPTLML